MNRNSSTNRSVVITSMGFITSLGNDRHTIIKNLKSENVIFERPPCDPSLATIPITDFNVKAHTGRCKEARYLNRGAALSVASAMEAVKHSCLERSHLENAGIFLSSGPNMDITEEFENIKNGMVDEKKLSALFLLKFLPNTATSLISKLTGIHGENMTSGSACAASLMAIGEAFLRIKSGRLDVALAGGGDSRLSSTGLLSYKKAGALWQKYEDPYTSYIPFGDDPCGFIPGEGGAFFVIESLEHATKRNARILAEIKGYGITMDGHAMTAPEPNGYYAEKAVEKALLEAGLIGSPDLVSAHGTGTPLNDRMEKDMLSRFFSDKRPFITGLKSWIGHLASACGAVELAICITCAREGFFPGIRNFSSSDKSDLNIITEPKHIRPESILLENFGFGGQNCALVVKPWI